MPWHPQECYYYAVEHGGFRAAPERTAGTYSKYSSIDDKIDDLHYYTTFVKFGIGRATYDASQEARNGDITRDEGVALIRRYDGEYSERFEQDNFAYLSLPEKEFPRRVAALRAADRRSRILRPAHRQVPLAAHLDVEGRRVDAAADRALDRRRLTDSAKTTAPFGLTPTARRFLVREVRSRPRLFAGIFVGSALQRLPRSHRPRPGVPAAGGDHGSGLDRDGAWRQPAARHAWRDHARPDGRRLDRRDRARHDGEERLHGELLLLAGAGWSRSGRPSSVTG